MNYHELMDSIIKKNSGLILTKDVVEAGISKTLLSKYVANGDLERVAHGVYLSGDAFEDDMYVLQARSNKAIFSHETALYIHDLTDRDPLEWVVTLPSGYNATRLKEDGIKVYFIKRSLHTLGVEEAKTIHGRSIRIYNKERTICDMIRNRSSMDIAILNEGMKRYIQSRQRNIPLLVDYANQLQIESILRKYLEVLL